MRIYLYAVLLFSTLFFSNVMRASHILGGEITYSQLSYNPTAMTGLYLVTLNLVSDCNGLPMPNTQAVSITGGGMVQTLTMTLSTSQSLSCNNTIPCMSCANVCNQSNTYLGTVNLPYLFTGYTFSYTECCRNGTIVNIQNPSANSFYISTNLNGAAQNSGNTNPAFAKQAPLFFANNQVQNYDLSATDVDGDSLVYSICGVSSAQNTSVTYMTPFSAANPMGSNALVLNSQNGFLRITPTTSGTFVVGVCVSEYRNGALIGSTTRDWMITVVNTTTPVPHINASAASVCAGGQVQLSVTGTGNTAYLWSPNTGVINATLNNPTVTVTATGVYQVTVTTSTGCTATSMYPISVIPPPSVSISGPNAVCNGQSATLTASSAGATGYLWSTGATTPTITVSPMSSTTYLVTVTGGTCTAYASHTLNVGSAPIVMITGNTNVCQGSSTVLTASGAASYLWSNGSTAASITVSPAGMNLYTVTGTSAAGCSSAYMIAVNANPLPIVSITGTNSVCNGNAAVLTASGASSYLWSDGSTTASVTVSPTVSTTYSVVGTSASGCTAAASFSVAVNPIPTVVVNGLSAVCAGTSTVLTANGASSYLWADGSTTASVSVSPTSATTYSVTGTSAFGCSSDATISLGVNPLPSVSLSGNTSACDETTITAQSNSAVTYIWSVGGQTSTSVQITTPGTTNVIVTVTDANGCIGTANLAVVIADSCVYPGDANYDGYADNQDILALGLTYGATGTARTQQDLAWSAHFATGWNQNIPATSVDAVHTDCNGDGTVNADDTLAITQNYGSPVHPLRPASATGTPLVLTVQPNIYPGGDFSAEILLGDNTTPADEVYGLAFNVLVDQLGIFDPTAWSVDFSNSVMGTGSLQFSKYVYAQPSMDVAVSRTNHQNLNGIVQGRIATLHGRVMSSISPGVLVNFSLTNVNLINAAGVSQPVVPVASGSMTVVVGNQVLSDEHKFYASPNPAKGNLKLVYTAEQSESAAVTLTDITGKKMMTRQFNTSSGINTLPLDIAQLPAGVYFVSLESASGVLTTKVILE